MGSRTERRASARIFAFLVAFLSLPSSATAQSDWLQKGQDLLRGLTGEQASPAALTNSEIRAGLKEALRVGTERVVDRLGRVDGFNADPQVHVPLPQSLQSARETMERVGLGALLDDLELKLNRAAEAATPKAKRLFWDAISQMTLQDVRDIYDGPDDAATRYFERRMSDPLAVEMRPVVDESLSEVGAVRAYDDFIGQYRTLPFVPDLKADLTDHVLGEAIEGIFHYLAQEEAAIRREPAKRTTELLRRVFGTS